MYISCSLCPVILYCNNPCMHSCTVSSSLPLPLPVPVYILSSVDSYGYMESVFSNCFIDMSRVSLVQSITSSTFSARSLFQHNLTEARSSHRENDKLKWSLMTLFNSFRSCCLCLYITLKIPISKTRPILPQIWYGLNVSHIHGKSDHIPHHARS